MQQILDALNGLGPWGVLIGVAVAFLAMKLKIPIPALPLVNPTPPTVPAPLPAVEPGTSTLADAIRTILIGLAKQKFPWLSAEAAAARYVGELVEANEKEEMKRAAAVAAATAKPTQ